MSRVMTERLRQWLLTSLPFLWVLPLYAYALTLPFFADDGNHYRFLQQVTDVSALWLGQTWSPYYRPVVYTLWKVMVGWQGGFDPVAQHAVNVLLFGMSGVLLGVLARRLLPVERYRNTLAMMIGSAFVLFPFHYQAVNLVGSLTHIAVTFFVLSALVSGLRYLRTGDSGALLICWMAAVLATFTHETGFLVVPFLLVTAWLAQELVRVRRVVWMLGVPAAGAVLYILIWIGVPRVGTAGGTRISTDIVQNIAVLSQAFTYPLAAVLRPLIVGKAPSGLMLALFAITVMLGLALVAWLDRRLLKLAVAGVVWFCVCITPSVLFLQPDYVWSSPRLTVLASVGAIVFWACVLVALARAVGRWQRVRFAGVCGVVALIVVIDVHFLAGRALEYAAMSTYTKTLAQLALDLDVPTRGALLVNPPNYIETLPTERTFLVGSEYASFMTFEVDYRDHLAVNTNMVFTAPIVAVGVGRTVGYFDSLFVTVTPLIDGAALYDQFMSGRPIFVTDFRENSFVPIYVGMPASADAMATEARFGDHVILRAAQGVISDNTLRVATEWTLQQPVSVKMFVHVLCDDVMIAQSDGVVWGNLYPFSAWRAGESERDIRTIVLPNGTPPRCLRLYVGIYDENTGIRTSASAANGTPLAEDRYLVPIVKSQDVEP